MSIMEDLELELKLAAEQSDSEEDRKQAMKSVISTAASVRKTDELGRITLTGVARNLLHVGEGDPVRISVDTENGVILVRKADAHETENIRDPFARKVDQLGRIVLPVEIRAQLDIREGELLDIFSDPDNDQICIKKAIARCLKCESTENLTEIRP